MNKLFKELTDWLLPRRSITVEFLPARRAVPYQRRAAYAHHPGRSGLQPTRFGDWEYNGRCTDFS